MARWLKTCKLIQIVNVRDEYGVPHESETERLVRCNPFTMGMQAYYRAANSGVHPVATIQLWKCDYHGERLVEYEGARLSVDRIDGGSPDYVTLTLVERLGEHG